MLQQRFQKLTVLAFQKVNAFKSLRFKIFKLLTLSKVNTVSLELTF